MIHKNRSFHSSVLAATFGVASAVTLLAQGPGGPPRGGGPGGHHGPPPNALFDALDTNHDGAISADEITNAPASLKAMLKNGATELKREDLRPQHPPAGQNADGGRPERESDEARPAQSSSGGNPVAADAMGTQGGGDHRAHHGPPPNALFDAIDANHDNVISADEMNNAPAAIKTLLKNGATQLTREDLRPPRPPQQQ